MHPPWHMLAPRALLVGSGEGGPEGVLGGPGVWGGGSQHRLSGWPRAALGEPHWAPGTPWAAGPPRPPLKSQPPQLCMEGTPTSAAVVAVMLCTTLPARRALLTTLHCQLRGRWLPPFLHSARINGAVLPSGSSGSQRGNQRFHSEMQACGEG